jgi:hypothetical protein
MPDFDRLPSKLMQKLRAFYSMFVSAFVIKIKPLPGEIKLKVLACIVIIVEASIGMVIYSDHFSSHKSAALFLAYIIFNFFVASIVVSPNRSVSEYTCSAPYESNFYNNCSLQRIKMQSSVRYAAYTVPIFILISYFYLDWMFFQLFVHAIVYSVILFSILLSFYFKHAFSVFFRKSINLMKALWNIKSNLESK